MPPTGPRLGRPRDVKDTSQRCLAAAEQLFAVHGFDGTSLRDLATAIGITSAAVIHHFGTKERLYGKVLERLTDSLGAYLEQASSEVSVAAVVATFEGFMDWCFEHRHLAQLLLRELIENRNRVTRARRMHLSAQVTPIIERIARGQASGLFAQFDADLFVFYHLGAITHFSTAEPTIERMLRRDGNVVTRFRATLRDNVTAMLVAPPSNPAFKRAETSGAAE